MNEGDGCGGVQVAEPARAEAESGFPQQRAEPLQKDSEPRGGDRTGLKSLWQDCLNYSHFGLVKVFLPRWLITFTTSASQSSSSIRLKQAIPGHLLFYLASYWDLT